MYTIEKDKKINQMFVAYHRLGLWNDDNASVLRKIGSKWFFMIFYVIFLVSLIMGIFLDDTMSDVVFSVVRVATTLVLTVKLFYILWKKDEIIAFTDEISAHSISDLAQFNEIKKKLKNFMDFATCFILSIFTAILFIFVASSVFRKLPLKIAFFLDLSSEIGFWLANLYLFICSILSAIFVSIAMIVWYLMLNCSIKYEILGNRIRNMGSVNAIGMNSKMSDIIRPKIYLREFIGLIKTHLQIQKTIKGFKSLFSVLFFVQITTSGICICCAIYGLVFAESVNVAQHTIYSVGMVHNIFDIFLVMYFGNKIKLSSDRLSYCLYESNWIDQSKIFKKCMIIVLEVLKHPQELVIGKLYPLNLETFTSILKFAYSAFNMLQNLK